MSQLKKMLNVTTTACLLCSISIEGSCVTLPLEQIVSSFFPRNQDQLIYVLIGTTYFPTISRENALDGFRDFINNADDPLISTRQYFQTFIDHLNAQNGTSITVEEVCRTLREQKGVIPAEYQEAMLMGVDLIQSPATSMANIPVELLRLGAINYAALRQEWAGVDGFLSFLQKNAKDKLNLFQTCLNIINKKEIVTYLFNLNNKTETTAQLIIFALIAAGITTVAVYRPEALEAATDAMIRAYKAIF